MKNNFRAILGRFSALLFPHTCVLCNNIVEYGTIWCGCSAPFFDVTTCAVCSKPKEHCICAKNRSYSFICSPLEYTGNVKNAVVVLKNRADKPTVEFFANQMNVLYKKEYENLGINAIVAVPTSEKKLRAQGFNHAELLALALSEKVGIPYYKNVITRANNSLVQHTLKLAKRKENAQESYKLNDSHELPESACVLIIDDVCTSGATLNACCNQLKPFVSRIYGLTATNSTLK